MVGVVKLEVVGIVLVYGYDGSQCVASVVESPEVALSIVRSSVAKSTRSLTWRAYARFGADSRCEEITTIWISKDWKRVELFEFDNGIAVNM